MFYASYVSFIANESLLECQNFTREGRIEHELTFFAQDEQNRTEWVRESYLRGLLEKKNYLLVVRKRTVQTTRRYTCHAKFTR